MAHSECVATIVWTRLEHGGEDACRLLRTARGWRLQGALAGRIGDDVAHLAYDVVCDHHWRTHRARVQGFVGARTIRLTLLCDSLGRWQVNGQVQPEALGCVDLDLAFTPATNLIVVRREALPVGQTVSAPAAYLEEDLVTLTRLEQSYRRIDACRLAYTSPRFGYAADLVTDAQGFVRDYPGLFRAHDQG